LTAEGRVASRGVAGAQTLDTVAQSDETQEKGGGTCPAAFPAEAGDRDYQVSCAPSMMPEEVTLLCRQAEVAVALIALQPVVFAALAA